jgi:1-acyl-sn-glycerol-3-phosphate acyltransferase
MRTDFFDHAPGTSLGSSAPAHAPNIIGLARSTLRSFGFALALAFSAADYFREACFFRGGDPLLRRARWLHRWCRVFAKVIGLRVQSRGRAPARGMIVSNHLSYLDIVAYSALAPCVFVAKKEVAAWPVFGWFAQMAGTIFVDRRRRLEVGAANCAIESALRAGAVVVLFAEGTSSGGQAVLPFRSALLDAVRHADDRILPAAISYELEDGSVPDEVCYWGEMTLLPHLLNLFAKRRVRGHVAFGAAEKEPFPASRKDAARHLHGAVAALHRSLAAA